MSRCCSLALFAMGVHSTFFGPIKYAILPQHLDKDEVLGGTGLVEAGTYIAILGGTLLGGVLVVQRADGSFHAEYAALACWSSRWSAGSSAAMVPPAPPRPTRRRSRWTGTSSAPRSAWSARRCTSRACSWRSSRSASSGRWARCSPRNSRRWSRMRSAPTSGRDPVPGDLLDRRRDRLGRGQPAAQGPGLGALFARLGAGHGAVRPRPLSAA